MSIKIFKAEWDRLGLSWINVTILIAFFQNEEDNTVVINARRFLLRPVKHYNQCHQPVEAVKVSPFFLCFVQS